MEEKYFSLQGEGGGGGTFQYISFSKENGKTEYVGCSMQQVDLEQDCDEATLTV